MTKGKKLGIFLIVIAFIFLGFMREFIFTHLNTVLYNKSHNQNYEIPQSLLFLNHFDYKLLYISKWIITPFFCVVFFSLQWVILKYVFAEKKIRIWLVYFYLMLLLLSVLSFGIGYLVGHLEQGYRFSRLFMGLLQSPVPLMFLLPVGILKNKYDKQQ